MKIWSDKYPFKAEAKGTHVEPTYDLFIVTSNYSIEGIYGPTDTDSMQIQEEKNILVEAIKRRFTVVNIEFPKPKPLALIRERD